MTKPTPYNGRDRTVASCLEQLAVSVVTKPPPYNDLDLSNGCFHYNEIAPLA